jgi:hypothetical protein
LDGAEKKIPCIGQIADGDKIVVGISAIRRNVLLGYYPVKVLPVNKGNA